MLLQNLEKRGLIKPPMWMTSNICYLTRMGSTVYGVESSNSDQDIYGVTIPPRDYIFPRNFIDGFDRKDLKFDVWVQHHILDKSAAGGKGIEYDFSIYNITKYFNLVMENNPNTLDSLFVRREHIIHITRMWNIVRDNRKMFLHKGVVHRMRGYAYNQLASARNCVQYVQPIREFEEKHGIYHSTTYKQVLSKQVLKENLAYLSGKDYNEYLSLWEKGLAKTKRFESQKIHNTDCFEEKSTEFLTDSGWKFYKDITKDDKLGTVNVQNNHFSFQSFTNRIRKKYTGVLYNINGNGHSCLITENHNMLVSRAERSKRGYKYTESDSLWRIIKLKDILESKRSWFHIRKSVINNNIDYKINDDYLIIAGLFLSEGTIVFKNKKVYNGSFCQTSNGKLDKVEDMISNITYLKKYSYKRKDKDLIEYKWSFGKKLAEKIYNDFGHAKNKKLPQWVYLLSPRQTKLLWDTWFLGDGSRTTKNNGDVIYCSSYKLISQLQALMTASGFNTIMRGPYNFETSYGLCDMYQLYLSDDMSKEACVGFGRQNLNYPITTFNVKNYNVVCFETPNETLITRHNGKISIQGNCKFLYHVFRLVDQAEFILNNFDLDLQEESRVAKMKAIRAGELTYEQIAKEFSEAESRLLSLYNSSKLPREADRKAIRNILLAVLEDHYGNLSEFAKAEDAETEALKEIKSILQKYNI